jgi:hypothetical protein
MVADPFGILESTSAATSRRSAKALGGPGMLSPLVQPPEALNA